MTDAEIIEVVTAHKEGKQIQFWNRDPECGWCQGYLEYQPIKWDFLNYDYRVKPEPRKPREWQVTVVNGQLGATGHTITNTAPVVEHIIVREVIEE